MKKILALIPLFLSLLACTMQPIQSTATEIPATVTEVPPTSTTSLPTPSPTSVQSTAITVPAEEQVMYYYFVDPKTVPYPDGGIIVMPETYILAPTLADADVAPEPAGNLNSALEAALQDSRNGWMGNKLEIISLTFDAGHAEIVLQGEYFGVGDVNLIAACQQILLTVFANANVHTATVTLNEDTVGNMGVSNSMNARSVDYVFTRAEIETYMSEHAYGLP